MKSLFTFLALLWLNFTFSQNAFITTWKTDNPGTSDNNQITIPTFPGETYDYSVEWGDGTSDSNVTGDIIHTYATPGTYLVSISGEFPRIYHEILDGFENDSRKLVSIVQWGNQRWSSMERAFAGCENMDMLAVDIPDLSDVDSMDNMFSYCYLMVGNDSFSNWDVSNVSSMSALFFECYLFNQNISIWNVSNLEEASGLFYAAESFNQDIGNWDISSLKYMGGMFNGAINFNQDIGNWDVSNVTNFNNTFARTDFFNQDLSNWNVSNAITFAGMFSKAIAFNQDISNWDTSNAKGMEYMFDGATSFNQNISSWDVGFVTSMQNMFAYTSAFNQNISNWDVSSVTDMSGMFRYATAFNQPIGNWDVSNVTNMSFLFEGASSFNQDISNWDVSSVANMFRTFTQATLFNQPIGNWNVSNVTNMEMMFWNTVNFNQPLNNWNVSSVTTMKEMFSGSLSFNQDINNWDVSNVETMLGMFAGASSFNSGLNSWNTGNVNDMNGMFFEADNFNQPIDNWDLSSVTNLQAMFFGADSFNQPIDTWDVSGVINMSSMFERATSFSQALGNWDISKVGNMQNMFNDAGLSQSNYDSTLTGWSSKSSLQNNVKFNGGSSTFCAGEGARLKLINQYGWEIIDGGKANCPFITTWKTDNPGISADNQITIPIYPSNGFSYNYDISWGDGSTDSNVSSEIVHTYSEPGVYEVSISGSFPGLIFNDQFENDTTNDSDKLIVINQWGTIEWGSMAYAYQGCENLEITASDTPNLSNVFYMNDMFSGCYSLIFNESIGYWDISNVVDISSMFLFAFEFNQPLNNWDTGNVTNMASLFYNARQFNQPLDNWDTGKVVNMNTMFQNADSFNQPLDNWETSSVENMSNMFLSADLFNQNLNSWDVSSVTNMAGMFDNSGLNLENYDKTLIGWSNLPSLQNDVVFNGGDSQYCESEEARQYLIDTYGWTITDGGKDPLCNQDNDLDGILDHKDNCLNTVPNATVNESGCEIIPNNAISVYGLTPTCPGTANGSIQVSSSLTGRSYNISLDGPTTITENSVSLDQPFVIDNLSTGLYTVEISIPEVSYNQSFGIQINEVGSISGKRENLDLKSKSVSYYVEGSHSYKVNINGKDTLFNFDSIESNQIQLNDLNGFNTISISGKSDCQGIIKDSFNLSNSVVMYPVNTKDKTFIEGYDEQSEVQIFDISGRLLFQKKLDIDKLEFIDIESYDPGMYPVKIISNKNTQTFKIIKQ